MRDFVVDKNGYFEFFDEGEKDMEDGKCNKCEICGEPMPEGEEMFKFHGYSGPCPKQALPHDDGVEAVKSLFKRVTGVDVDVRVVNGEFLVTDTDGQEFKTGIVRKH